MLQRYTVSFSPLAINDIQHAVLYYENIKPELSEKFQKQLQATLNAIQRNALFASIRYDDIRCAQVKNFPYLIHYHANEENKEATVIAVYATYQQPLWE